MFLTCNCMGDVHEVMGYVNTLKCAQYLFQIVPLQGACILIFKVLSREDLVTVRQELVLNPKDD